VWKIIADSTGEGERRGGELRRSVTNPSERTYKREGPYCYYWKGVYTIGDVRSNSRKRRYSYYPTEREENLY